MKRKLLILAACLLLLTKSYSQLFTFNFTGTGTCPTQNDTVIQPANVKVTGLARYGSLNNNGTLSCVQTNDYFNTASWNQTAFRDTTQYIEFVLIADSSTKVTLTAITFLTLKSSTGPDTILIAHNATGSFSTFSPKINPSATTNNQVSWTFPTVTTALGGVVKFRIYGWKASGSTGTLRINNLSVYGSTTVNGLLSYDYNKGYVGIGLPTPTLPNQRLQVNGNISSDKIIVGNVDSAGIANYQLAVNGTAIVNKLIVKKASNSTPWPDYVFDQNYKLISLDSLGLFIHQNNHLPEVPSAKSTVAEGTDVYATQALLLRKIEELTLYILKQNTIQKVQANKISQLSDSLKKLQKQNEKNR